MSLKLFLNAVEVFNGEDSVVASSVVAVLFEEVPAAEYDVVELSDGENVFDLSSLGFAQFDGGELSDRADGSAETLASCERTGNESGGNGTTDTYDENA